MARSRARTSPVSPSFPQQFWAQHPANRQRALRRERDVENAIKPFSAIAERFDRLAGGCAIRRR
jgi:hypothetical protein